MTSFPDVIPQKEAHIWATMIPGRSPDFKVHKSEALANSAMGQRGFHAEYAKYKLESGGWTKVFEYHPPTICRCGNRYKDHSGSYYRHFYEDPSSTEAKYKQKPICRVCYETQQAELNRHRQEQRERAELARLAAKYK